MRIDLGDRSADQDVYDRQVFRHLAEAFEIEADLGAYHLYISRPIDSYQ